jgi:hypothetical protein
MTVHLFVEWGRSSDDMQVVIHIFHSELQFPSKMSLAQFAFEINFHYNTEAGDMFE